eukprot:scaffold5380_cov131-Cylindrotheca_fusiformis.AAC.9
MDNRLFKETDSGTARQAKCHPSSKTASAQLCEIQYTAVYPGSSNSPSWMLNYWIWGYWHFQNRRMAAKKEEKLARWKMALYEQK